MAFQTGRRTSAFTVAAITSILIGDLLCVYPVGFPPSDSVRGQQWNLHGAPFGMNVVEAWKLLAGNTSPGIVVGMVEKEGCVRHLDLEDVYCKKNEWCESKNFDEKGETPFVSPEIAESSLATALIIAARPKSPNGLWGICPTCRIICLKASSPAAVTRALGFLWKYKVKVSSHSYTFDGYRPILEMAFRKMEADGHLLVVSAGKDRMDIDPLKKRDLAYRSPQCFDSNNILVVGALGKNGKKLLTSNYGKKRVHVVAPGGFIPVNSAGKPFEKELSGAGLAIAQATGVAALIKIANPFLSHVEPKKILISKCRPVEEVQRYCRAGGTIDAYESVKEALITQPDQWNLKGPDEGEPFGSNAVKAWKLLSESTSPGIVVGLVAGNCVRHPDLKDVYCKKNEWCESKSFDEEYEDPFMNFGEEENKEDAKGESVPHSLAMALIIAARPKSANGLKGICPTCRIMCLKATKLSALEKSYDHLIKSKVKLSSHSYSLKGYKKTLYDAIRRMEKEGHLLVTSAGNEWMDIDPLQIGDEAYQSPQCFDLSNILVVGAIEKNGKKRATSNWGASRVHIMAPGGSIPSLSDMDYDGHRSVRFPGGSSEAVPHVVGVAASIWTEYPRFSYLEIIKLVISNSRPVEALKDVCQAGGTLDAYEAIKAAIRTRIIQSQLSRKPSLPEQHYLRRRRSI